MRWQQIIRYEKKDIDLTIVKHFRNIVSSALKYENMIYIFIKQLFISVLLKNIA